MRSSQQGQDSCHLNGRVARKSDGTGVGFWLKRNGCILSNLQDVLVHFLVATFIARLTAAGRDGNQTRHLGTAAVKVNRSGLDVKGSVDNLVSCFECHSDLAVITIDDESLTLGDACL